MQKQILPKKEINRNGQQTNMECAEFAMARNGKVLLSRNGNRGVTERKKGGGGLWMTCGGRLESVDAMWGPVVSDSRIR